MSAHYPITGMRVVSGCKLTYAAKIGFDFIIVQKGTHGTVTQVESTRRRMVKFDSGYEVSVATQHLLRPGILDRIATAIAKTDEAHSDLI